MQPSRFGVCFGKIYGTKPCDYCGVHFDYCDDDMLTREKPDGLMLQTAIIYEVKCPHCNSNNEVGRDYRFV